MDFIFEINVKKPLRKDSLYIWGKFFAGLCYQRSKETILNKAKEYYENDKERLRKQAKNKYRELPE